MDQHPPRPRPPLRSATESSAFSRISTVSDITDFGSFDEVSAGPPMQVRPGLGSLQTTHARNHGRRHDAENEGHVYASPTSGWTTLTRHSSIGYSPVSSTDVSVLHNQSRYYTHRHHDAISEEDGVDLGVVGSAPPIACDKKEKPSIHVASDPVFFDLTSALGPTTPADEAFIKAQQQQEAYGKLTGGLGDGIKTDTTVTEPALLATSPVSERAISRRFSRAGRPVSRAETVRRLGQSQANKRGEVIEVVIEGDTTHSEVDLSLLSGHTQEEPAPFVMRQTTFPTKAATATFFYPQPNWKPFSMTWPYLLSLVVLSLGLGAAVEVLYRSSTQTPLVRFHSPCEIPTSEYFAVKFLPMIVAVSYGVLWQITNFEVMRLEPFYQLSKEGGALAAESINVDYLTQFNLFRPIRALRYRHYAVAVSSVASLLANTLVPTLSAASLGLAPDRDTRLRFPGTEKQILVHHVWSRLLTATLATLAVLGSFLFYLLQTRRSGLFADVNGIAGLASMATVSHILMDFKDMDVASHQDIHAKLSHRRYVLRNSALAPYDSSSSSLHQSTLTRTDGDDQQHGYTQNHLSANPHPLMLRPHGALPFLLFILLSTALLPTILFTPAAAALTDRAPWLLTALAVVIKLTWAALETDIRLMEPYYILSRRHAPARTLCLDYTAMPFGWVAVKGLLNRHWVVFWVGVGTVVAEVLTVLVTSLATVEGVGGNFSGGGGGEEGSGDDGNGNGNAGALPLQVGPGGMETVPSFWASLALALAGFLYLAAVAGWALVRRGRVFLPRQPNTIASVLAYLHQSKMLYGFVGTARLGSAEMVARLEERGKTYGLGWFQGRDGQSHCGVDEEELLSGYKVGYDYSRATKPWEEAEVRWL
ncbi:hypothetical protein N658DRAFT_444360 [Parathielavia hyrcaniae]|uniref:Uncharacterized protein n=1 Tax=Parathielavia hyrcaniae TaxID=113614 RepID=A0AAN6T4W2_9PEZI|nr:hypothetical protein N658DRAFT_444360 [Parathielavia hyrcaniae]